MDKKGFISIEYLFLIFIVLIIAVGLLFFTSASIGSTNNIADNVEDSTFVQAFRCKTGNADASDVKIGDTVIVYGDLTKYNSTYEFAQNCSLESLVHPKLYSGRSYLISKNDDGEIVIK